MEEEIEKDIIDKDVYICLYFLMKYILLGKDENSNINSKLKNDFVPILKENGFDLNLGKIDAYMEKQETTELEELKTEIIRNINIVFNFIKSQNSVFAGEIMENIIIKILSQDFKVETSDFFGKYLYNNLQEFNQILFIKKNGKEEEEVVGKNKIKEWFINKNLKNFFELEKVLSKDFVFDKINQHQNPLVKTNILFQFLLQINFYKYIKIGHKPKSKKSESTSIYIPIKNLRYSNEIGREQNIPFGLVTSFFISIYIYCHNKQNPLMTYSQSKENLINLPFVYELSEAAINDDNLVIVLTPIRLEKRIVDIQMNDNRFESKGILELCKVLIFNRNIKKICINGCEIKPEYFEHLKNFCKYYFRIIPNTNIKFLDMSKNYR